MEPAPVDAARLALLQRLAARLAGAGRGDADAPDGGGGGGGGSGAVAIVAVAGWDSCWHAESAALLDWLCGGAAPPGALAVVTAGTAAVLAPAAASGGGGGRSSGGGSESSMADGQAANAAGAADEDDDDAARAALAADPKVAAFRAALAAAGGARVAVPLGWEVAGGALRRPAAAALLARWPLVQALQAVDRAPMAARFEVGGPAGRRRGAGRGSDGVRPAEIESRNPRTSRADTASLAPPPPPPRPAPRARSTSPARPAR
jgi:hypothetical protein